MITLLAWLGAVAGLCVFACLIAVLWFEEDE